MSRKFANAKFVKNLLVEADAAHRLELGARDHQDLRQCERDPLPELVGRGHRVLEELPLQRLHGVVLAVADVRGRQRVVGAALARIGIDVGEGAVAACRLRELLFERERGPLLHHFRDPAFGRPEARLLEEAHRVARTGGLGGGHGARRGRRRGCRRRGARCGRSARCGRGRRCRRAARRCGGAAASRCSVSAASRCGVSAAAATAAETAGEAACDGEREQEFVDATCGVHAKLLSFDERHSSAMERGCRRIKRWKVRNAATARAGGRERLRDRKRGASGRRPGMKKHAPPPAGGWRCWLVLHSLAVLSTGRPPPVGVRCTWRARFNTPSGCRAFYASVINDIGIKPEGRRGVKREATTGARPRRHRDTVPKTHGTSARGAGASRPCAGALAARPVASLTNRATPRFPSGNRTLPV